jgi:cell division protease FtsH
MFVTVVPARQAVLLAASTTPAWVWVLAGVAALILVGKLNERRTTTARRADLAASGGFAGVAGCDEAIEDLREIVSFLVEPERFERFGAVVPKGALLVGPPGTGKTLLARAVAAEAEVPFLSANGSDFVEMFVGVGAKRIRELYQEARSHGRAIVFIDEIDAIARKRSSGANGETGSGGIVEHENTLIALLTELDGFTNSNVITMAATNRPDVIDAALLRPGRLERRIEVPTPDRAGRAKILEVHAANKPLGADVDLVAVASRTSGMSGADLARVCNEAAIAAVRLSKKHVDAECFDEAVEIVAIGRPRTSTVVTERDRRITAWHESGHATLALLLEESSDPVAVTIVPRGPAGGVTWMGGSDDRYMTRDQAETQLMVMLGGRVAEEILLGGGCTQGASSDLERATELASGLISRFGMTSRGLAVRNVEDNQSRRVLDALLEDVHRRATIVLTENFALLEAIAEQLLVNDRLDAKTLVALRAQYAMRPSAVRPHRAIPETSKVSTASPVVMATKAPRRSTTVRTARPVTRRARVRSLAALVAARIRHRVRI